jgi:hypothetical protein
MEKRQAVAPREGPLDVQCKQSEGGAQVRRLRNEMLKPRKTNGARGWQRLKNASTSDAALQHTQMASIGQERGEQLQQIMIHPRREAQCCAEHCEAIAGNKFEKLVYLHCFPEMQIEVKQGETGRVG